MTGLQMDQVGVGVLAVEVAADRNHASICAGCRLPDGRIQIELVAYLKTLNGTAIAVDRVVEFHDRWKIHGTVVDPMVRRRTCGGRWVSSAAGAG